MSDIRNHEHAETLLDDFVMGTLSAEDLAWMEAHLETCSSCNDELIVLLEATAALAWSSDEPPVELSPDLWDRIESSLDPAPANVSDQSTAPIAPRMTAGSDRTIDAPGANRPSVTSQRQNEEPVQLDSHPRWNQPRYRWLAIAALALIVVGVGAVIGRSLWLNDDEPAQQIALHDADGNVIERAVANLEYRPDDQQFVLHMEDMPAAPEGQVYQAWLIASDGPIGVGIVDPATGVFRVEGDRTAFDAFAITIEPGPDGSAQPTTNPIVVAPLNSTS